MKGERGSKIRFSYWSTQKNAVGQMLSGTFWLCQVCALFYSTEWRSNVCTLILSPSLIIHSELNNFEIHPQSSLQQKHVFKVTSIFIYATIQLKKKKKKDAWLILMKVIPIFSFCSSSFLPENSEKFISVASSFNYWEKV